MSEVLKNPCVSCFIFFVTILPWVLFFHERSLNLKAEELDTIILKTRKVRNSLEEQSPQTVQDPKTQEVIHILTYSCSRRKRCPEVAKMLSSLKYFSSGIHIHFHVIYDEVCQEEISKLQPSEGLELSLWSFNMIEKNVQKERPFLIPFIDSHSFRSSTCHIYRLFMFETEPFAKIDKMITIDSDTLFVNSFGEELINIWENIGDKSIGVALEALSKDGPGNSYYTDGEHEQALTKFIGETGANAGVLFMNFKKLRATNFIVDLYQEIIACENESPSPCDLSLAEQDMLNYYFSGRMDNVHILPCTWNYRMNLRNECCTFPTIIHGSNFVFYRQENTLWKAIYDTDDQKERNLLVRKMTNCSPES